MTTPTIYVACLAAYNNGFLHGEWIDATQDIDEIYAEISKMLKTSPFRHAEEFAIHDFEGFGDEQLSEYDSIEHVVKIAQFIIENGELGGALLGNYTTEEAEKLLEDHYNGAYESEVDFASSIFEDCYANAIPENLKFYFDYEAFARDLFINDYFSVEVNGKIHVFSNY